MPKQVTTEERHWYAIHTYSGYEDNVARNLKQRVESLGFETKIRVLVVAEEEVVARSKIRAVVAAFKQFNVTNMNGFLSGATIEGLPALELYRSRSLGFKPYILNIEESASIYHLPGALLSIWRIHATSKIF